jgi:hypothetical protein
MNMILTLLELFKRVDTIPHTTYELISERITQYVVGFEVFTAVVMKSITFWDMTPCSPSSFNLHFGGTYRFQLQGRRNKFSKNQLESRWQARHGVISQKMVLFITTAVKTLKSYIDRGCLRTGF